MVVSVFVMMDFSLMVQAKLAMHVNLFVKPAKKALECETCRDKFVINE